MGILKTLKTITSRPRPPAPAPVQRVWANLNSGIGDGSWELKRVGELYMLVGYHKSRDVRDVVRETNAMAYEFGRLAIPFEMVFPSDGSVTYMFDPKYALKAALGLPGIKVEQPIE